MSAAPLAHSGRAHALLSASGAERWLNCTPSARLEEQLPDTQSEAAKEGTLAHEIAELKARKTFIEPMTAKTFNTRLNKLKKHELYREEMLGYTDIYIEYIQGVTLGYKSKPHIAIEAQLDYSHIAPEGFGTGDCIIIGDNTLHIIDFKYGKGVPVSADDNPQMKLYALGALKRYSLLYQIDTVKLTIVQPRLDSISEWEISAWNLLGWGEEIKSIASAAYEGIGEFNPGDWCRFCRAKAQCRARSENMTALEAFEFKKPPLLTNDEVGGILVSAKNLKAWATDLETYALKSILSGKPIKGWKAVAGRSNRQFNDLDKAFDVVKKSGVDEALLYERKPLTLTAVETLLGKKKFEELLKIHVIKAPGAPTLAQESDSREEIINRISAEEAFKEENGGN